jgi:hypothetical protein
MSSCIFDSFLYSLATGQINISTATFKVMQVSASFTPDRGVHSLKSQVTNEVTGTNWTTGGIIIPVSVSVDTVNHQTNFLIGPFEQNNVTISNIRYSIIYEASGIDSTSNLVAYIDWGTSISKTAEPLALGVTPVIWTHPTPR